MSLQRGVTIANRYEIRRPLGRGGMGEVWLAFDLRLRVEVALKALQRKDPDLLIREIRAAREVISPNVCRIFDLIEADGLQLLSMEYVDGITLRTLLDQRSPLELREAQEIASQFLAGLEAIHKVGLVHRDFKPSNVMITRSGRVVVMDLGLARVADAPGSIAGTPAYMAPEQMRGERIDARADIYAAGVVLAEMLPPGEDKPWSAPLARARALDPEQRYNSAAALSRAIEEMSRASKAVDRRIKDSDERYQSINYVSPDLKAAVGGSAPISTPVAGRWRRVSVGTAIVVLTVAVVAPIALRLNRRPAPRPAVGSLVAILPFTVHGGEKVQYLGDGMADLLSVRLNGTGELRTVDSHGLLAYANKHKGPLGTNEAMETANRFGARMFVTGDVLETAAQLHVSASLYDASGDVAARAEASVSSEKELDHLVDEIAIRLLPPQKQSADPRLTRLAMQTTSSLDALKEYLAGERDVRGSYAKAAEHFERAVEFDRSFALAWYRLSVAQKWSDNDEAAVTSSARALQFAGRLYQRDQELLKAWDAFMHGRANDTDAFLRVSLGLPAESNEVEHCWLAAETAFHLNQSRGRDPAESRRAFERVLALNPDHFGALAHLADVAMLEGNRLEARKRCAQYTTLYPQEAKESGRLEHCRYNDGDKQKVVDDCIRSHRPQALWWCALNDHDYVTVERLQAALRDLAQSSEERGWFSVKMANYAVGRGRYRAAIEDVRTAEGSFLEGAVLLLSPFLPTAKAELESIRTQVTRVDPHPISVAVRERIPYNRLYALGLLNAKLGNPGGVAKCAAELRKLPPLSPMQGSLTADFAATLDALGALMDHDSARALEAVQRAPLAYVPDAEPRQFLLLTRFLRAQLLEQNGQLDEALRWYKTLTWPWPPMISFAYEPIARYRMAGIYERLGRPQDAAREYAIFIEAWKDCDPELRPMLRHAKERLAAVSALAR